MAVNAALMPFSLDHNGWALRQFCFYQAVKN
jgi:hypothetical protein